jgi:uncharacterized protein YjiS (DUF1127 family)
LPRLGLNQRWYRRNHRADGGRRARVPWKETVMTLKIISEKIKNWQRTREAIRELSQLSDRDLADLGIRRADIESVVRESVRNA